MKTNKLFKLAKLFETKLSLAESSHTNLMHIVNMAKDLVKNKELLEKAVLDSKDIYEPEEEKHARMFRVRRLLSTMYSTAKQMAEDTAQFGLSASTAANYKNYFKMLLAWLRQIPGINKYNAMLMPLENALDAFTPGPIYTPGPAPKLEKSPETGVAYEEPSLPLPEGLLEEEKKIYYGPGMEGKI